MTDEEKIGTLQSICEGISYTRARELLEASNGSLERAIDIFFHQEQTEKFDDKHPAPAIQDNPQNDTRKLAASQYSPEKNRPHVKKQHSGSPFRSPSRKQARLESFFDDKKISGTKSKKPVISASEIIAIDSDDDANDHDNKMNIGGIAASVPYAAKEKATSEKPPQAKEAEQTDSSEISFQKLAETLQQLTDTTKRLVKLDVLKVFILYVMEHEKELDAKVKTLTNSLLLVLGFRGNSHEPMAIGGSALSKALQTILGASRSQLSKAYREFGDMGDVAASLFQKKTFFVTAKTKQLSILKVYQSFNKIVGTDGRDAKQNILLQLLRSCRTKMEIRFLVRLLIGNMRIGANLKTVLAAVAMAVAPDDSKRATELIQKTYDICPKLDAIIQALLEGGLDQMTVKCGIQVLTPIAPMLAHPTHSLDQVAKVMKNQEDEADFPMTMEFKYDGVRCQAHFDGSRCKLLSRHMLETTAQYPDATDAILAARRSRGKTQSFVLDAEIVGVESIGEEVRLLPFQDLSRRKKTDDGKGVRIKVFCFDLMFINGESLINKSLRERQAKIREHFVETADFAYVTSKSLPVFDEGKIRAFLEESIAKGTEGLMLKLLGDTGTRIEERDTGGNACSSRLSKELQSLYEAGTRSHAWLKVKRDYVEGYADTIDVVPIGAWYGNGRKAQKSFLSPVLLAVYDEEEDVYKSVSRCMSFTDAMYESMREFYFRGTPYPPEVGIADGQASSDHGDPPLPKSSDEDIDFAAADVDFVNCFPERPSSAHYVTNESPPVWFKPMEVFEVSFADMSLSRQHTAGEGIVDDLEGRGVALRFPRFKRRRPDKRPDQATTCLQIATMFSQQSKQSTTTT